MRVAVGGLHTECSTYNPVLMTEGDFTVWRGAGMLEKPYFDVLKRHAAQYLPTFYARNIAGGPIARETYERFKAEFLAGLRAAMPLDGLYLCGGSSHPGGGLPLVAMSGAIAAGLCAEDLARR